MNEKHFCRCCLSEECYKDMSNTYYIGSKTENYFAMLLNIFNITIINSDAERCLICEECVSKLRDAAAFKKRVLDVQETFKHHFTDAGMGKKGTKTEDVEDTNYFDDFDDNISDKDFLWDNFTDNRYQKGQHFFITLNSTGKTQHNNKRISKPKKIKPYDKEIGRNRSTKKNSSIQDMKEKDNIKNPSTRSSKQNLNFPILVLGDKDIDYWKKLNEIGAKQKDKNPITLRDIETEERRKSSTLDAKEKDEDQNLSLIDEISNENDNDFSTVETDKEDSDVAKKSRYTRQRIPSKKSVTVSSGKQNKDKLSQPRCRRRELSQTDIDLKFKNENTLNLIKNSNICLFRSLRNKFGCYCCPLAFPEFKQLREHSLTHVNPIFLGIQRLRGLSCRNADISDLKCNLCSENCTDLQILMDHLKKQHDILFPGTGHYLVPYKLQNGHQCAICELKFNTYIQLTRHMNTHFKNNVCDKCGLSFISRLSLRVHVQAQHKENKCQRCHSIFVTLAAKNKHLRQVHGIRTTKRYCTLCNKTFKYSYMLEAHKIQDHNAKKPAISVCTECGKSFSSQLCLKTHFRCVHLKERNYPCSKCAMRFFTSTDKRRHERTHEDVKSFCCIYCDVKFKSQDSLRRHLKKQHGHVSGKKAT